eukprot:TRINITY_DN95545_c0_g1_i1.p1 TRINITY_DN95545_c0_g1~~TRINITY_DN95545_c0_g1_i1.p1  ORF type:complete len:142 (-),score=17.72 TRINITY_DN95545_c0_g1_i1:10-435(-)
MADRRDPRECLKQFGGCPFDRNQPANKPCGGTIWESCSQPAARTRQSTIQELTQGILRVHLLRLPREKPIHCADEQPILDLDDRQLACPVDQIAPWIIQLAHAGWLALQGRIEVGTVVAIVEIGRAVQQECRDRSRMPSSA